jgi:tRNA modification GTPase
VFSTSDTIVAVATPPGRGGIGVVRLSGGDAHRIALQLIAHGRALEPRHATFTRLAQIDQVIATYFPAPRSYTGDDVVELSAHGSPVVLRAIVSSAIDCGARPAEPGEFTLRAFLNGRIDLVQAEAVGDLIEAVTPLQARSAFDQLQGTLTAVIGEIDRSLFDLMAGLEASIDFPEEGYHFLDAGNLVTALDGLAARTAALLRDACKGRLVRDGLHVAIVGRPNVGKSSLFNALLGTGRAIVSDVPGTTRDLITEVVDIAGLRVTLVDTAGLRRDGGDLVEAEGIERALQAQTVADLTLLVLDRSRSLDGEAELQTPGRNRLLVANKADIPAAWRREDAVEVSAVTGLGIEELRQRIVEALEVERMSDCPEITNLRHITLVRRAHAAFLRARAAAGAEGGSLSEEFVLADLQEARAALEEISGRRAPEELLANIFSRFCIGK